MYIFTKSGEKISLIDKTSARNLMIALSDMDCTESISTQCIIGTKPIGDLFEVSFADSTALVVGLADAELAVHWLLSLGFREVSIKKGVVKDEEAV